MRRRLRLVASCWFFWCSTTKGPTWKEIKAPEYLCGLLLILTVLQLSQSLFRSIMEAHEILGISKNASEEQIRAAYKALVRLLNFHRCENFEQ